MKRKVTVHIKKKVFPTYLPAAPDRNPMFLEKRVYQGSNGKIYPLPCTDRIADKPVNHPWTAVWIENDFLRVLVLPELGGRIHAIQDKSNGYDLIYNQPVIKPALVGLAGPWASGGIEFNWPQHHRPATFLPVDFKIEAHADGSQTVWCSDHDPMCRMKGMHGICLHPDSAYVELKVRAYNRTPFSQTFLWWANVATRVHEAYQSFFPPDVYYVADHARRSMCEYPLARTHYYGVDYGRRGRQGIPVNEAPRRFPPPHGQGQSATANLKPAIPDYAPNDLSFYANIPVPTSYMCMGSRADFFGGYDYKAQAGIVHIANHHISPGKKQWTWGNHEFGHAWDRNLTDPDAGGEFAPYIEIMAGVYTDNQPDFSFLQPGETKTWSQYWYPIRQIGPAQHANLSAAIHLSLADGKIRFGVSVTSIFAPAKVRLTHRHENLFAATVELAPGAPLLKEIELPAGVAETDLLFYVADQFDNEIISYQPKLRRQGQVPPPAAEPASPPDISNTDELYLTGLHLEQYRHATRSPLPYWREALRRDPGDARCNNALGLWHLKRGDFAGAETCFRQAIARLTRRNANPCDSEAYYNLGLCLRQLGRDEEAYDAFYKSVWNQAWQAAGYHALAEIDASRHHWPTALDHCNRSLRFNTDNLRARNLKVMVLRSLGRNPEAKHLLAETLALDPLDWWARHLHGEPLTCDAQTALDLAHDLARAGCLAEGIAVLRASAAHTAGLGLPALPTQSLGSLPLVHYTLGWLQERIGDQTAARTSYETASRLPADYCFPARLEEIAILTAAMRANPADAKAPYYLGNLLYDRQRQQEAVMLWEKSAKLDSDFSTVWRNLGLGYFNIRHQPAKARIAYDRAFRANPLDARLLFERDQLWKRLGVKPERRLRELTTQVQLVARRDDLSLEFCALLNQTGRHDEARQLLASRNFQPWEGGEGGPLGQHVRTHLALGRQALSQHDSPAAISHFKQALTTPRNLGEARHLLANQSELHYWLGCALEHSGARAQARHHWQLAARFKGDFQGMRVRTCSEMTHYSALSLAKLGQKNLAGRMFLALLTYSKQLQQSKAEIDYFATSLPTMLLFDDDLQFRQTTAALFLQAQARLGLGQTGRAKALLKEVLRRDPNHALAADLSAKDQQKL